MIFNALTNALKFILESQCSNFTVHHHLGRCRWMNSLVSSFKGVWEKYLNIPASLSLSFCHGYVYTHIHTHLTAGRP